MFTISVPAHWSSGIQDQPATVYGSDADGAPDGAPVVVARGRASVPRYGEPLSVRVDGWRPAAGDWDKLKNDGPGEWVCTAERTAE